MITKRQKQVLDFITGYQKRMMYAPSLQEIRRKFKLASVSTAHFHVSNLRDLGYLSKEKNKPRSINVVRREAMVKIPLLGTIAAGQPIEAIQEKETIAVPQSKLPRSGNIYALRVVGDSMIDENINDGDVILVKEQSTAESGQKVVALIDNYGVTLKKFYKGRGHIRLQPANNNVEPIILERDTPISIQGIFIDVIKSGQGASNDPTTKISDQAGKGRNINSFRRNQIIREDCVTGLRRIPHNSIDSCITDPPYNYEFIGHKWDSKEIKRRTERVKNSSTLIKYIPYGSGLAGGVRNERWYKKNAENINEYREWCSRWGKEIFRVLKPGAYILVFNSTRTIAHVQIALEGVGFYARDIIAWRKNSGIPKGLNFSKKLEKENMEEAEKWEGWHSCLRNEWEAIVVLQKPLINNYLETVKKFNIGLLRTQNGGGNFRSNIIENVRRDKKEEFNIHCTVKPLQLISQLIDLTTPLDKSRVVLDPFMGSGTTAIAALEKGTSYLGFEINNEYCRIAQKRIQKYLKTKESKLF